MLELGRKPSQVILVVFLDRKVANIAKDKCSHCAMDLDYCFRWPVTKNHCSVGTPIHVEWIWENNMKFWINLSLSLSMLSFHRDFGGCGEGVLSAATASRITVEELSVHLKDHFVALVTEDAGSCDMVTCFVSNQLTMISSC